MYLRFSKMPIYGLAWIAAIVILVVVFHLGGSVALRIAQFAPLSGALIGGTLTLGSALYPRYGSEHTEPWGKREQWSWIMIGSGIVMWGLGESIWRYFIANGQNPFPSVADLGYSTFAPLVFAGLLLQPRPNARSRRTLLLMDSLISTGSILAIAWYLLLGSLTLASGEASLATFLGLYYPVVDTVLLSCVIFLLLRGGGQIDQSLARRVSLLVIVIGLSCFAFSDFLFNVLSNLGLFVEGTWTDLGWPLGMVTVGIAAYLRRFLPVPTDTHSANIRSQRSASLQASFSPAQFLPYTLLGGLLIMLVLNILSTEKGQVAIRPTLLYATVVVIALVVARQIVTLWDNIQLSQRQAEALADLERANQQVAEQAYQISERNAELEHGIAHLTLVQAQLANGNLRVRATLKHGVLLPLAGSLNIMAERLMRMGQENHQGQRLTNALHAVLQALEESRHGVPFSLPGLCANVPEINRLLILLRLKGSLPAPSPSQFPFPDTFSLQEYNYSDTPDDRPQPDHKNRGDRRSLKKNV